MATHTSSGPVTCALGCCRGPLTPDLPASHLLLYTLPPHGRWGAFLSCRHGCHSLAQTLQSLPSDHVQTPGRGTYGPSRASSLVPCTSLLLAAQYTRLSAPWGLRTHGALLLEHPSASSHSEAWPGPTHPDRLCHPHRSPPLCCTARCFRLEGTEHEACPRQGRSRSHPLPGLDLTVG